MYNINNVHSKNNTLSKINELSEDETAEIKELEKRDREVRSHEQAHIAVGGNLIRGGPSFEYQYGPDGKRYAIGGHVDIDTSPGRTPEETIIKADKIVSAALAPADPSAQDRSVASSARKMKQAAIQEKNKDDLEKNTGRTEKQKKAEFQYRQTEVQNSLNLIA